MTDAGTRTNVLGIAVNVLLAITKLVVGTLAGSAALVADGLNSTGDVLATAIGLFGYLFAKRPADENHPFGHGNAESVAGLVIGGTLLATGVLVTIEGIRALVGGPVTPPEGIAVAVAMGTAVVKEGLYRVFTAVGRRANSPALLASAADHRADVLIALTVAAGIAGSRLGLPWLDPLAAVVVGLWIVRLAVSPIRSNLGVLMDESPAAMTEDVTAAALAHPGVRRVDLARVHPLGPYAIVDLEIAVDPALSLLAAHAIAHDVEERVRSQVEHVREVRVHVNPG
jgi:cation diffusion facilitator family transporter